MIDIVAFIVCILIMILCLASMKYHFISSRGYKILGIIGAICVLILLVK